MNKLKYPLLMSALMLAACGSDNDSNTPPVDQNPPTGGNPPLEVTHDNFDLKVQLSDPLEGEVHFYIGRWYPCSDTHPEFCTADDNLDYDEEQNNKFTPDPIKHEMTIKVSDLKREMGQSINPQVAEGQFTILDLMLYVSKIRDDFHIDYQFDEAIGTYRFVTSFDSDGNSKFEAADGEENFENINWYPRFTYTGGNFKREIGPPTLEAMYERPEEFMLRPNAEVRYEPFTPLMTERREYVQTREVQRLKDNDGKVVLGELQVDFGDGNMVTIAENITVDNYNLRPDLFADGVYTIADALMSAHNDESLNVDIGFTVWPTLSTGSNVGAYAVTSVQGDRAEGFNGWLMYTGELETASDFFADGFMMGQTPTVEVVLGNRSKYCPWIEDMTEQQAEWCIADFNNQFGGNMLHHMSDSWVINYPHEVVQFKKSSQNGLWQVPTYHYADGQYDWYDISKAVAPMDESHFGWGIADCSQCHSIDNVHLNGDSPLLPPTAEPYYCAQCHGSNGAPSGHGEEARCHWCHSEDKQMNNHGGTSLKLQVKDTECHESIVDQSGNTVKGPCANTLAETKGRPVHDKGNNFGAYYEADMLTSGSSDYHMDSQFPDPYSCVTCHPNTQMDTDSSAN